MIKEELVYIISLIQLTRRNIFILDFEPYCCNLVFPVFDQPDIKATMELSLIGPDDWILLSNEKENLMKK